MDPLFYTYSSGTETKHYILAALDYRSPGSFDELQATDFYGNTEIYPLDLFRRLYNDAVETMLFHKRLSEKYYDEADRYRAHCNEPENSIRQTLDPEEDLE